MNSFLNNKKNTKKVIEKSLPWVEKYRPKKLDDVVQQEDVTNMMKRALRTFEMPHLLFYGSPGTGKTSTILALARELFGNLYKERVLELNASDERGINVVRNKIRDYTRMTCNSTRADGKKCPEYRIIILDEADCMTKDAQSALRFLMEMYGNKTRFVLICNYLSRIIEPMTSRCAKFRFRRISDEAQVVRLKHICDLENIAYGDGQALQSLVRVCEGDLRRSITLLQSFHSLKTCNKVNWKTLKGKDKLKDKLKEDKYVEKDEKVELIITEDDISEIGGHIPNDMFCHYMDMCKSETYIEIDQVVMDFINSGYSVSQLLQQLCAYILIDDVFIDVTKANILSSIAEAESDLLLGADDYLQLMKVSISLHQNYTTYC